MIGFKQTATVALLAIGIGFTGVSRATLFDRGGGLIYDDVLNLTWLQDANYAKTSDYDADGLMDWKSAQTWAADLIYQGYSDWSLPNVNDTGIPGCSYANSGTDCGFNVDTSTSELAYMYHVNLGLKSIISPTGAYQSDFGVFGNGTYNGVDLNDFGQKNLGPVVNLQAYAYWFSSEYAPDTNIAWDFSTVLGGQNYNFKSGEFFAWAIRNGDVVLSSVPEPAVVWLFVSGLGLLALSRRRKNKNS